VRSWWLVVVVLAAGSPAEADGVDPSRIERARSTTLSDEYQPALPGNGDGNTAAPARSGRGAEEPMIDTRSAPEYTDVGPLGKLLDLLLWGAVIVGGALFTFWLASELVRYGADDAELDEAKSTATGRDEAVIERPLGDAEELARRGEYREAIHTLLLRTLQELVRAGAVRVSASMTSREILARVPLLADARVALANLITAVELTHFGGDSASVADYDRCLAHFRLFATAYRAGTPNVGRNA
jgi:hypothetical protein